VVVVVVVVVILLVVVGDDNAEKGDVKACACGETAARTAAQSTTDRTSMVGLLMVFDKAKMVDGVQMMQQRRWRRCLLKFVSALRSTEASYP